MNAIVSEIIADTNAVLEKVIQAQVGLPTGIVDPVLMKVEGALEGAIAHFGAKPTTAAVRTTDGDVTSSTAQPA
jgi:hypothetical protein